LHCPARDLLVLARIPGIGTHRLRILSEHFEDAAGIAGATARQLIAVGGIDRRTALNIVRFFQGPAMETAGREADEQLARLARSGGHIATLWDERYPSNLRTIYDPPPLLFMQGEFLPQDNTSIAVVGTRVPTPYGIALAERFSLEMARRGITVISGLARGIDTSAHTGALRGRGRTIAVIGSGIDVLYPAENRGLAGKIAHQGAVVSEFEMGTKPDAMNFPRRNRIVSGIALGTLVIETGIEGGAMITAAMALDQNREVFAIPSALSDRRASGTNRLIKEGKALLTESLEDIITELGPRLQGLMQVIAPASEMQPDLTLFERRLTDMIDDSPVHIDLLAERAGMSAAETMVHLLSLEFKGAVRQLPGKRFVRM
jgi:DNA processing protein